MKRKNKTRTMMFQLGFTLASVELGTSLAIVTISEGSVIAPEKIEAHVTKRAWVQNPVRALQKLEDLTGKKGWKWIA